MYMKTNVDLIQFLCYFTSRCKKYLNKNQIQIYIWNLGWPKWELRCRSRSTSRFKTKRTNQIWACPFYFECLLHDLLRNSFICATKSSSCPTFHSTVDLTPPHNMIVVNLSGPTWKLQIFQLRQFSLTSYELHSQKYQVHGGCPARLLCPGPVGTTFQLHNVVNVNQCKIKLLQMCHFLPEDVCIWSKFYHVKYLVILLWPSTFFCKNFDFCAVSWPSTLETQVYHTSVFIYYKSS